jgi:uncharacterized protein (DUF2384 family)
VAQSLMAHVQERLHEPQTGRLDAQRVAHELHIPVSRLARALGVSDSSLQKNPASASIQETLGKIAYSITTLEHVLGSKERVLKWFNAPHPDLGGRTPLSVIEAGSVDAVNGLLKDALAGQMT